MDNIIEKGSRNGLFAREIELNNRYATIIRYLKDEVNIFSSFRDAYLNSAIIGFLKNTNTSNFKLNENVKPASIFPNELSARRADLRFVFRIIMSVKDEDDYKIDDYMNRTFRDGSEEDSYSGLDEKMEIFNTYVCKGLDYLYNKFENIHNQEEIVDTLYEILRDIGIESGLVVPDGLPDFDVNDIIVE